MSSPVHVFTLRISDRDRTLVSTTNVDVPLATTVVVRTEVPELGLAVRSSYVGTAGVQTRFAHLWITPQGRSTDTGNAALGDLPVDRARDHLVLDHAFSLRQAAAELAADPIELTLDERALQAIVPT